MAPARDQDPLDPHGVRRGPEQGDGCRRARDGRLPVEAEAGHPRPLRGLLVGVHNDELRRDPGGERPQGRALHDSEIDLHRQEVASVLRALLGAALVFWVAAAAWWTAAPAWGGGPLAVVATSTDLKALLEEVGGDRVRVEALASPGQDPHTVEVTPGRLAALQGAALVVRVGLDHEPWLAAALRTLRGRRAPPADLDCSNGIALLQTETARVRPERGEHVHGFGNTHYWLDPENARPITAAMVATLGRLAPEDRAGFESRRAEFLKRLDAGLTRWSAALAPYRGAN